MSVLFKIVIAVCVLNAVWLCSAMWKAHQRARRLEDGRDEQSSGH